MKSSIISTIVLALAASVELAEGCAQYQRCRCQMADGSPNNNVTTLACEARRQADHDGYDGADGPHSTAFLTTTDSQNTTWCNGGRNGKRFFNPDNCLFRDACTQLGATGSDSWCEGKLE
ncbi:hypothetical protein LX32DRAFT_392722 [Colletotrichum zoysiae]|uniref:Cyanovirin-N domain-containing protein n=1 Tax=Colletotrichum zoysiae TaxID=1216348 RepID=A0AAD9HIA8_9PEZI|nr:hypothetical protein LX32DRAFT_392722 [Colletotrichum zoysiae]